MCLTLCAVCCCMAKKMAMPKRTRRLLPVAITTVLTAYCSREASFNFILLDPIQTGRFILIPAMLHFFMLVAFI